MLIFSRRISVRYHLPPFTRDQKEESANFHLRTTGTSPGIFEPEAKVLIHEYASGIPRRINHITTACLINASSKKLQKVNEALANETMAEFQLP